MNKHVMWDAQAALGFVVSQTSHIEQGVNKQIYPDIQYPDLVPVDTSAHPWAKTVTYFSSDQFGKADWINGNADDIPLAGTERTKFETGVHMAGIGYGYGMEELQHAMMMGINLTGDDAEAARRAYEEMVDRVALYGDTAKFPTGGLINNTAITPVNATVGGWATATPDQIAADINLHLIGMGTDTKFQKMANTLLLPYETVALLASRRMNTVSDTTIFDWFKKTNVVTATTGQPLLIRGLRGLTGAGVSATNRMIVYNRDPRVLKMHIPMPHRFLEPYKAGPIRIEVPGIFRVGGLDIRYPKEFRYVDGI